MARGFISPFVLLVGFVALLWILSPTDLGSPFFGNDNPANILTLLDDILVLFVVVFVSLGGK